MGPCLICSSGDTSLKVGAECEFINSFSFLFKVENSFESIDLYEKELKDSFYCVECNGLIQLMTPVIEKFKELEKKIIEFRKQIEDLFFKAQMKDLKRDNNDIEMRNVKIREKLLKIEVTNTSDENEGEENEKPEENPNYAIKSDSDDETDFELEETDSCLQDSSSEAAKEEDEINYSNNDGNSSKKSHKKSLKSPKKTNNKPYKFLLSCQVPGCNAKFLNEKSHLNHYEKFHKGIKIIYKCPDCPKTFTWTKSLFFHMKQSHLIQEKGKPFECKECGKKLKREICLKAHMKRYHCEETIKINCSICSKKFMNERELSQHKLCHEDQNFICEKCPKTFKRFSTLKYHMLSHEEQSPSECKICHRILNRPSFLEIHMQRHLGQPNFHCKKCEFKGSTSQHLKDHMNTKHRVKSLACENCGKFFSTVRFLKNHELIHKEASLKCPECPKMFKLEKTLQQHKASVHEKLERFKCPICDVKFTLRKYLLRHAWRYHEAHAQKIQDYSNGRNIRILNTDDPPWPKMDPPKRKRKNKEKNIFINVNGNSCDELMIIESIPELNIELSQSKTTEHI